MPKPSLLPPVLVPPVLAALVLAGCGTSPMTPVKRAAAKPAAASLHAANPLAAYEAKPSTGEAKHPIAIPTVPGLPAKPESLSIEKMQLLASGALAEAEGKQTWNERVAVTGAALAKIDAVKLEQLAAQNIPAKIGMNAVKPYGYIGMWPTAENRYKVQAVTLAFFKANGSESALAKGAPLFAMSADMIEVTTNWDQGFKVGIAILSTIRDEYKDKAIAKSAQGILDKAVEQPSREEAYKALVAGLRQLATNVSGK